MRFKITFILMLVVSGIGYAEEPENKIWEHGAEYSLDSIAPMELSEQCVAVWRKRIPDEYETEIQDGFYVSNDGDRKKLMVLGSVVKDGVSQKYKYLCLLAGDTGEIDRMSTWMLLRFEERQFDRQGRSLMLKNPKL